MERVVRTQMYHLYHPPISQEAVCWTLTPRPRMSRSDRRLPEDLPVVEQVIVPEEVKLSPERGVASARKSASTSIMNHRGSCAADWCGASTSARSIRMPRR